MPGSAISAHQSACTVVQTSDAVKQASCCIFPSNCSETAKMQDLHMQRGDKGRMALVQMCKQSILKCACETFRCRFIQYGTCIIAFAGYFLLLLVLV